MKGARPAPVGICGLLLLILLPASGGAQIRTGPVAGGECGTCHQKLDERELQKPAVDFLNDIHGIRGQACTACHGGDARSVSEATAHLGMLARPPRNRIPELCGRCHSNAEFMKRHNPDIRLDQVESYRTSVHGHRLFELGDTLVATCVDCHSSHAILPAVEVRSTVHPRQVPELCGSCHADPAYMADYDVPTDQLDQYRKSIHWKTLEEKGDLSSPVCNDCHGNHGAVPPGYASVGRVCAECHTQIGDYFALSPHDTAFVRIEQPGCATCHGNHDIEPAEDELLGLGEAATCRGSGCHSAEDEGGRAARAMLVLIDSLRTAYARADSILVEAEHAGMPVSQAQFELNQVRNALVGARAAMHTSSLDSVQAKVEEGLTAASGGYAAGVAAFEELEVRRFGLAVSAAVILILIVGLLIRIRQLGGPTLSAGEHA